MDPVRAGLGAGELVNQLAANPLATTPLVDPQAGQLAPSVVVRRRVTKRSDLTEANCPASVFDSNQEATRV